MSAYTVVHIARPPFVGTQIETVNRHRDIGILAYARGQVKWESCYRVTVINQKGEIIFDELGDYITVEDQTSIRL